MSRGKELQEMEVGTKQSKTAVNAGAKAAEPARTTTAPNQPGLGPRQTHGRRHRRPVLAQRGAQTHRATPSTEG